MEEWGGGYRTGWRVYKEQMVQTFVDHCQHTAAAVKWPTLDPCSCADIMCGQYRCDIPVLFCVGLCTVVC